MVLEVTIPVNSTGKVSVPTLGLKKPKVKEGERVVWKDGSFVKGTDGVVSGEKEDKYVTFEVGSGTYRFTIFEGYQTSKTVRKCNERSAT